MLIYLFLCMYMLFSPLNGMHSKALGKTTSKSAFDSNFLIDEAAIAATQSLWISTNKQFKELCAQGVQELTRSNLEILLISWDSIIARGLSTGTPLKTIQQKTTFVRPKIAKILRIPQNNLTLASITLLENPLFDNNLIAITHRAHQLGLSPDQIGHLQKILILLFGSESENYYDLLVRLKNAIFAGNQKKTHAILLQSTPVNGVITRYGRTGLMVAVRAEWTDIVAMLLKHSEIDINAQDLKAGLEGWTALHHAVSFGNLKVCKLLLNHPLLNIDIQTTAGETAVMIAAQNNDSKILAAIFEKFPNVDLSLRNTNDKRALDLAATKTIARQIISHFKSQCIS